MHSLVDTALVAYGTLQPGEANHWLVAKLGGRWYEGTASAWDFEISWGAAAGYPGVIVDSDGPAYDVLVLVADKLAKHWPEIDQFEGEGYRRIPVEVTIIGPYSGSVRSSAQAAPGELIEPGTTITASIYEAVQDNPD